MIIGLVTYFWRKGWELYIHIGTNKVIIIILTHLAALMEYRTIVNIVEH